MKTVTLKQALRRKNIEIALKESNQDMQDNLDRWLATPFLDRIIALKYPLYLALIMT